MKNILFYFALLIFTSTNCIYAQSKQDRFNNRFDDAFEEEENENLTLRFFNALTGDPIPDAEITLDNIDIFTTDEQGKVRFPVPDEDGFILVHFEKDQFIDSDFKIEVIAGTLFFNRFSVSPKLDLSDIRIVVDWSNNPADLDAHFIKSNDYHLSYRNTRILADGNGELDRDDRDGFGPETITIRDIDDLAEYTYKVHDYSNRDNVNSKSLSKSKACVKVYGEGKLLYIFQSPSIGTGTNWEVFKIVNGDFIAINKIKN